MPVFGPPLPSDIAPLVWPQVLALARRDPQHEAVVAPNGRFNYDHMTREVFRYQRGLSALGLRPGDRLAAMVGNDWPYLALYWAALASGLVFVPLNPKLARPEVATLLQHAEPALVVADDRLVAQIPESLGFPIRSLSQWQRLVSQASPAFCDPHPVTPDDVAVIFYTSGTTGQPKGVMLTHRNLAVQYYQAAHYLLGLRPNDRVLSCYPLHATAQHVFLEPPLIAGATSVIEPFSPKSILSRLQEEAVTIFFAVPTIYQILLEDARFSAAELPTLRILAYGGTMMARETIQRLKDRFPHSLLKNLYGQTENSPSVTSLDDPDALTKPGSVGKPVPGMTIAIVDDADREVDPGVVGEIVTRGPNLMKGYYKDEASTEAALRHGWYHTGDLGYCDSDGYLYVIDRKKDMITRGGQNIYPLEVETVLSQHPAVQECAVIGVPHPILGEEVAAVIVRQRGALVTEAVLRDFLSQHLASYKVPVHYYFVDALPHNASGRVLKRELRTLARRGAL
ncbi:MAG: AMP-binding protein [Firmicutes bacterium]|nr:AMP-binding protein [Bacillota bacterium]